MKKGVFKKFAKFTVKHLCQSLFFNKVEDLKHTYIRCFLGTGYVSGQASVGII